MTTGNPVFVTFENLGMFLLGVLILAVLLGGLVLGWRAGLRDKQRHHQQLQQAQRTRPADTDTATAELQAEYARDDDLAVLRSRYENGEIDRAVYEREVEAIRRRGAA